ncbi:MAG: L,D-transpeptidase family protein [Azospirillum sp.]|nr:L,D-transpeptidase family protein [Azospirillum sp.]
MEISVSGSGLLSWPGGACGCVLGRSGLSSDKREGDGATPVGRFPLRRVLFRADRLVRPVTRLAVAAIAPDDGWCDDPNDPRYNQRIGLPDAASHERMWRDDGLYDVVVVLGHNDAPVIAGAGSAIFLHVTSPDRAPTAGCVAVALPDLLALLADCDGSDWLSIAPAQV